MFMFWVRGSRVRCSSWLRLVNAAGEMQGERALIRPYHRGRRETKCSKFWMWGVRYCCDSFGGSAGVGMPCPICCGVSCADDVLPSSLHPSLCLLFSLFVLILSIYASLDWLGHSRAPGPRASGRLPPRHVFLGAAGLPFVRARAADARLQEGAAREYIRCPVPSPHASAVRVRIGTLGLGWG